jgi:DNA-directed RNA polymerase specialized sigma24 family protein
MAEGGCPGRRHGGVVPGPLASRAWLSAAPNGKRDCGGGAGAGDILRATRAFLGWRGGSPAAWLLAIARNVLADEVRRGQRLVPLSETLPVQGGESSTMSMGVRETLARLPATQGRLLELIYVDGYTHAEVAAMAGTTAGAVKTAVWRARQAFQQLYEEEEVSE